ncbi:hypothetical protein BO219_11465 [Anoxybacillus kestanbolensis]|uniref:Uncharacterized protein n=1 Tax=Anoxybacillus kestanbolensis TaxID=227476 RepID=A0A1V3FI13_9BACL|nr:hypothetical protein [Anoxybacillus kestanbolensis]OOE01323.1 hypothetical protein BO219_11465 [Anoxybacillus kestanbolensis]
MIKPKHGFFTIPEAEQYAKEKIIEAGIEPHKTLYKKIMEEVPNEKLGKRRKQVSKIELEKWIANYINQAGEFAKSNPIKKERNALNKLKQLRFFLNQIDDKMSDSEARNALEIVKMILNS